jgi:signal transduction histidine kinase
MRWGVATLVACLLVTAGAVAWSMARDARITRQEAALHGEALAGRVSDAVARSNARLLAVSSLFRASDEVTAPEFSTFVGDVGLEPSTLGVAYVAIVPSHEVEAFAEHARRLLDGFSPFALSDDLESRPFSPRDHHHLVLFVEPSKELGHFVGADVGTLRWALGAIERTAATGESRATAPFGGPDRAEGPFVVFQPVYGLDGRLQGLIAGIIDMQALVSNGVGEATAAAVDWAVTDVSLDRQHHFAVSQAQWHTTLDVMGRQWRVEVTQVPGFVWQWPAERILALSAGVLASLASAAFVYTALRRVHSRRENSRLSVLGAQKDHFLATVSHELRTPLTAVLGFLEEMRQRWDDLDADERIDLLTLAGDEAGEMAALVDDLLVGARLETGKPLAVGDGVLDIASEARSVVERLSRARGVDVEVTGFGWAHGDQVRVRQVLRNIVDNALKHGRPPVVVEVTADDEDCIVTVRDAGGGVPGCCRDSIFVAGAYTNDHTHGPVSNSNRLGLPVSAYLARLMGGALMYDDEQKAFVFILTAAHPDDARVEQAFREILIG